MAVLNFDLETIDVGGHGGKGYRAHCECGAIEVLNASNFAHLPPREFIAKKFRQRGWEINRRSAVCPRCNGTEMRARMEMDKVTKLQTAAAPRQMTQSDRRRVFREIDDAWDESRGRYSGKNTDRSIAEKLDVPRIWVEEIRSESFGSSARNEDFDKLLGNLQNLKGEVDRKALECLDLAEKYDVLSGKVEAAIKQFQSEA